MSDEDIVMKVVIMMRGSDEGNGEGSDEGNDEGNGEGNDEGRVVMRVG